jgi:hypothetical protein
LCGIAYRVHERVAGTRFEELRELCAAAGDKASLAIGMTGLIIDHAFADRVCEASQLASEAWTLIESIGDPTLTVGLSMPLLYGKAETAEFTDGLRWSQRVIDLADGDPSKGNFLFGAPLPIAITTRGVARAFLGHPGWRDDLRNGLDMANKYDPMSAATVVGWTYTSGIIFGLLNPDDRVVHDIESALQNAERAGDDFALSQTQVTLGFALVHRPTAADRDRGQQLLADVTDLCLPRRQALCDLWLVNVYSARELVRRGDRDEAMPLMRAAIDHLFRGGRLLLHGIPSTGVLVETLLDRGTDEDVAEAEAAIDRLASARADKGLVIRDVWLLRLRALLARARGDEAAYRDFRDRYRDMAKTLGFGGHIAWAEEMP